MCTYIASIMKKKNFQLTMVPSCINVININALENHKHVHISDKEKKKT
jgi:hypothetical protein